MIREDFVEGASAFHLYATQALGDIALVAECGLAIGQASQLLVLERLRAGLEQAGSQACQCCLPPPVGSFLYSEFAEYCRAMTAKQSGLPLPPANAAMLADIIRTQPSTIGRLACIYERQVNLAENLERLAIQLCAMLAELAQDELTTVMLREATHLRTLSTAVGKSEVVELRLQLEPLTDYIRYLLPYLYGTDSFAAMESLANEGISSRTAVATAIPLLKEVASHASRGALAILPILPDHIYRYAMAAAAKVEVM